MTGSHTIYLSIENLMNNDDQGREHAEAIKPSPTTNDKLGNNNNKI